MHVAIYARHSTDKQCSSAQDQIYRCSELCQREGYLVVDVFKDEALSGAHLYNRPGISALINAAVEQRFDMVVAEDLSRISRDQADTANFFKKMAFLDISIRTASEGIINELHIGLKSTMNALYLKDLADKTRRGMIASVLKGSVPGGRTYGYDLVRAYDPQGEPIRGRRRINDDEAAVVKQIYTEYAAGKPIKAICDDLNRLAIPAPKGGKWVPSTLVGTASRKTGLLRQTLYKGVVTFNRMAYRKHPETGKRLSVVRPENEWLNVPVPELTIIDEARFDSVQEMIEQRSSRRKELILLNKARTEDERAAHRAKLNRESRARQSERPGARHYLFSGRLFCGRHGTKIVRIGSRAYSCEHKHCFNRNIRFDTIMPPILGGLSKLTAAEMVSWLNSPDVRSLRLQHEKDISRLEAMIEEERCALRNILSTLGTVKQGPELQAVLDDKEKQLRRHKLDIEKHEGSLKKIQEPSSVDLILSEYFDLLDTLAKQPTQLAHHRKLRPFIDRIEINGRWDDNSEQWNRVAAVRFNYSKLLDL